MRSDDLHTPDLITLPGRLTGDEPLHRPEHAELNWLDPEAYALDLKRIDAECRALNRRAAQRMGLKRRASDHQREPGRG